MCGHWESKPPGYEIGDVFPGCTRCNTLRDVVIGKAAGFPAFTTTNDPLEVSQ
jgi:hypothetical protein